MREIDPRVEAALSTAIVDELRSLQSRLATATDVAEIERIRDGMSVLWELIGAPERPAGTTLH